MLVAGACMVLSPLLPAHEGVHHGPELDAAEPIPSSAISRPRWLPDGGLWVSKQLQHILSIRTAIADGREGTRVQTIAGEIVVPADATTQLSAPQPGTLEPGPAGWPLIGDRVQAGEVLAWLRPLLANREAARRRARVADLDQKIAIAQLNVDRIGLQNQANQGQVVAGNIYFEQASAELKALQEQRRLIAGGLSERLPVTAPAAGELASISRVPGEAVSAGQLLFQVLDDGRMRVAAVVFDPRLSDQLESAELLAADGSTTALRYRALETVVDAPGWRMFFDTDAVHGPSSFALGQAVSVRMRLRTGRPDYASACVDGGTNGVSVVWIHVAPEEFVPTKATDCGGTVPLSEHQRVVTAGAELLSQY